MDKIIERFKNHEIKENTNPFLPHIHLRKNTSTGIRQLEYYQIIRSLMYLINCTRLDIAYAVSKLSRYTSNPSDDHWTALCWSRDDANCGTFSVGTYGSKIQSQHKY